MGCGIGHREGTLWAAPSVVRDVGASAAHFAVLALPAASRLAASVASRSMSPLARPTATGTAPAAANDHGMDCCQFRTIAATINAAPQVIVLSVRLMRLSVVLLTERALDVRAVCR
jgi:hypothetical protein